MCTVTFVPVSGGSFLLTSSRDESTSRPYALPPQLYHKDAYQLMYPKDPVGDGTWIGASSEGSVVCLLNGASTPHLKKEKYRHSRGLVVLHFLQHKSIFNFYFNYNFQDLEPFTLIAYQDEKLYELRWDGSKTSFKAVHEKEPHLWSSATLYSPEVQEKRVGWFKEWLKEKPVANIQEAQAFHKTAGDGDITNDVFMNRNNEIRTTSITSIAYSPDFIKMVYEDVLAQTRSEISLNNTFKVKNRDDLNVPR